jgi:hypothetical protein
MCQLQNSIYYIEQDQWLGLRPRTGPRVTHDTLHTYAYMTLTSSMVRVRVVWLGLRP